MANSSLAAVTSPKAELSNQGAMDPNSELSSTGSSSFGSAVQGLTRIQAILVGHANQPSNALMELFNECTALTAEEITMRVKFMGSLFTKQFELVSRCVCFNHIHANNILHIFVIS